jgi:hypothetical protein
LELAQKISTPRSSLGPARHPSFSSRPSHNITNPHPQLIHLFLVDSLFRFESLRVAGVLDFCYWGSAASALALRFSSGTFEISVQPIARALVVKF